MTLQYVIVFVARLYYKQQKYVNDIKAGMFQFKKNKQLGERFLSITFVPVKSIKVV